MFRTVHLALLALMSGVAVAGAWWAAIAFG